MLGVHAAFSFGDHDSFSADDSNMQSIASFNPNLQQDWPSVCRTDHPSKAQLTATTGSSDVSFSDNRPLNSARMAILCQRMQPPGIGSYGHWHLTALAEGCLIWPRPEPLFRSSSRFLTTEINCRAEQNGYHAILLAPNVCRYVEVPEEPIDIPTSSSLHRKCHPEVRRSRMDSSTDRDIMARRYPAANGNWLLRAYGQHVSHVFGRKKPTSAHRRESPPEIFQ